MVKRLGKIRGEKQNKK